MSYARWVRGEVREEVAPEFPVEWLDWGKDFTVLQRNIESVLGGTVAYLSASFTWSDTPQGRDYWAARCYRGIPLAPEDRTYLRWLIEE